MTAKQKCSTRIDATDGDSERDVPGRPVSRDDGPSVVTVAAFGSVRTVDRSRTGYSQGSPLSRGAPRRSLRNGRPRTRHAPAKPTLRCRQYGSLMQRRQVLALGALSIGGLAGCVGGSNESAASGAGVAETDNNDGGFDSGVDDVSDGPPAPRRHSMVVAGVAIDGGDLVARFEPRPVVESRAVVEAPTVTVPDPGQAPPADVTEPTPTPTPAATNGTNESVDGTNATVNGTTAVEAAQNETTATANGASAGAVRRDAGPGGVVVDLLAAASPVGVARAGGRGGTGGRGGSGGSGGSRTGGGYYPAPGRYDDDDDDDRDDGAEPGVDESADRARGWNGRPKWDSEPPLAAAWYDRNGGEVSVYRCGIAAAGVATLGREDVNPPGTGPVAWDRLERDPGTSLTVEGADPGWYRVGTRLVAPSGHDFGWTAVDALVVEEGSDASVATTWKVSPQL